MWRRESAGSSHFDWRHRNTQNPQDIQRRFWHRRSRVIRNSFPTPKLGDDEYDDNNDDDDDDDTYQQDLMSP